MDKVWLKHYPAGVPAAVKTNVYPSLNALFDESFKKHRDLPAYKFMGKTITFGQVDDLSRTFAAYLQGLGLVRGDRVAIMMPNVPQYPVVVAGILRAGCVVVNVNPLYTPRELEHQLKDSGAKAIVIVELVASTLQQVIDAVPTKKVVMASLGDMLGLVKGAIVNYVVRHKKKMVPPFDLPGAVPFNDAIAQGRGKAYTAPAVGPDDIAVLQYTGGTTGVSKGAVLLHRNLMANLLQAEAWYQPALKMIPPGEQVVTVCALPLYHIFGFNTNMMLGLRMGGCNILIANPRDIGGMLKELAKHRFHSFPAVNTLFNAMVNHAELLDRRLVVAEDQRRRRHGGAECNGQTVAGKNRLPDRRRLRPVGDLAVGDLQPGGQHGLQRQHRPADAGHRAGAARRRRQRGADGHTGRDCDPRPAGHGRLLAAARRDRQGDDGQRLFSQRRHRHRR